MLARLVIPLACVLVVACFPAIGVRLLRARYIVDGEVVADVRYEDPDANRAPDPWDYLAKPPVDLRYENVHVEPDPDDPLRATLRGEVVVEISHRALMRRATLNEVHLVRDTAISKRWYMSAEEMERTRPPR